MKEQNLRLLYKKRCLQGFLKTELRPRALDQQKISSETFRSLFELPGWTELWTPAELGSWFAIGLTQYGPNCVGDLIDRSFNTEREALLWLFLGAHHWFHETQSRLEDVDGDETVFRCCKDQSYGFERKYVAGCVGSLSQQDKIWVIEQLVRHAPEFGACRDLGANIFNYFVASDCEADLMLTTLLKEICNTRLQYLFEYSISIAIAEYKLRENTSALNFQMARKYKFKLLLPETNLYFLLSGESRNSVSTTEDQGES